MPPAVPQAEPPQPLARPRPPPPTIYHPRQYYNFEEDRYSICRSLTAPSIAFLFHCPSSFLGQVFFFSCCRHYKRTRQLWAKSGGLKPIVIEGSLKKIQIISLT